MDIHVQNRMHSCVVSLVITVVSPATSDVMEWLNVQIVKMKKWDAVCSLAAIFK